VLLLSLLSVACVEWTPADLDGDGVLASRGDCDDFDAGIHPRADEVWYDGVDQDCDGNDADRDLDGYLSVEAGGDDCWDDPSGIPAAFAIVTGQGFVQPSASQVHPGADDLFYDGVDQDCDGSDDFDQDLDGYQSSNDPQQDGTLGLDCDDTDEAIHPDATETCDGVDQDCDGEIDDDATGATTWYADSDGDGYGDPVASTEACDAPTDHVADATDCDPDDGSIHPGADEVCDGVDQDCDTEIDEDPTDATTWYADSDGDGYGDPDSPQAACEAPSDHVADGTDCGPADATIHPGADETCDGVDEDCDIQIDEDPIDPTTWYDDTDGDGYGDPGTTVEACDAPTAFVADATDCDPADTTVHPGATETCDGVDQDCDTWIDEEAVDQGTWYDDTDGDGFGDAGASQQACDAPSGTVADATDCDDTDATTYPGADELCDDISNDCDADIDEDAIDAATWYLDFDGDTWGRDASTVEDCDAPSGYVADGGDCDDTDTSVNPGETEVCGDGVDNDCSGSDATCALSGEQDLSGALATLLGDDDDDKLGEALSYAGDLDGDGDDDLWVGTWRNDDGGGDAGVGYLLYGPLSGTYDLATDADAVLLGDSGDKIGYHPGPGGDVDADGFDDLVVGGFANGVAYLVYGPVTDMTLSAGADAVIGMVGTGDRLGVAAQVMGDQDGDGNAELLLSDDKADEDESDGGTVYLFFGPVSGSLDTSDADVQLTGETAGDLAGFSLDGNGDFDGNGVADLVIGSQFADDGADNGGAAWVFLGPVTASASIADYDARGTGATADESAGYGVSAGADVDGDGLDDVLVAAPAYDGAAGSAQGAVYVATTKFLGSQSLALADAVITGSGAGDGLGTGAALVDDVDGDGFGDVFVGAYKIDANGNDSGGGYLFYGPISGALGPSDADAWWPGTISGDRAGIGASGAGDQDGDGLPDLLLGAERSDDGGSDAGAAYVLTGI